MVLIKHNYLKSDIFLILYLFQVFLGRGFSGSRFFRGQVFRVRIQGPGSGSRVRVQIIEVANLEHKSHTFGIVILNIKRKDLKSRKNLCTDNFTYTKKILRTRNCRRKFIKILLPEKRKENM